MKSRDFSFWIVVAKSLVAAGITPNAISVAGMIAGLTAGIVFACTSTTPHGWLCFIVAAILVQLRLMANMLDGMVAVQTARASPGGELFNEVPDRISDAAILIGAGYAAGSQPELGYLAAIAAVFTAYVRAEGKVAGAHQEFCGPLAKPQRMFLVTCAALYAGLAPTTWQPQIANWPGRSTMAVMLLIIAVGAAFTAVRRLVRIGRALHKEKP
jgi:phosphatidylglycerophosphate synthase